MLGGLNGRIGGSRLILIRALIPRLWQVQRSEAPRWRQQGSRLLPRLRDVLCLKRYRIKRFLRDIAVKGQGVETDDCGFVHAT